MRYSQAGPSGKQTCLCAYCHFITSYLSVPSTTMQDDEASSSGAIAFALIYFTFFLDNVLLTVLVPIIPDWVRGESLELWTKQDGPLASMLNHTVQHIADEDAGSQVRRAREQRGRGASQAVVGAVLGAKAAAQLLVAPLAGAAVCRRGPAPVLRAATATLAFAALVFVVSCGGRGWRAALCVSLGRAAQGAGAALAGVAGLALAARSLPPPHADRAIGALLGAVALGVLVGYPFGGATSALWSRGAPFLVIAAALLADLGELYSAGVWCSSVCRQGIGPASGGGAGGAGARALLALARRGSVGACAGAVLLTTCVMASLEPCLPLWIMHKFHPQRWVTGAVFIPDSAGYLLAASLLGGAARRLGAERVALAGQLCVALAALGVPLARSVAGLALPHAALGAGLGAADAALVPALLARQRPHAPHVAALLQAASSAAYALGPALGGLVAWWLGFETAMRALGVLNLLYAAYLYRALAAHPLSEQWGAGSVEEDSDAETEGAPLAAVTPHYAALQ
ncbi:synaptic vesicular amine transporter-like [Trichoplusia ni]|uniref:Synaptic vesicular amine transporter-like n=1 Tax=Trichoplusia ni TaxID=7111 RepID=A0A7E5W5G0_TRINI|nr:synaptic vesicular amine transporter-like [Trichoplusia ni]